jgi:hypothetical protein
LSLRTFSFLAGVQRALPLRYFSCDLAVQFPSDIELIGLRIQNLGKLTQGARLKAQAGKRQIQIGDYHSGY